VIGERVLKKVEEFLESGAVQKLSELARDPNARAMKELQQVWGIGMRRGENIKTGKLGGKKKKKEKKLLQQIWPLFGIF
jgi:DNA polymerase/3'-5' exonuclease PolX